MILRQEPISWNGGVEQSTTLAPRQPDTSRRPSARKCLPWIILHGVRLHAITEQRCIEHIIEELAAGRGGVVVTPNVDHLRRCRQDVSFSALVAEANLSVADGMPLVWASRLQATPLPQRVAGSDLISSLSAAAAQHGRSIFLLGGEPGAAEQASSILQQRHPALRIAGTHCPPVGFEHNEAQLQLVMEKLKAAEPDIVYVALGSPKQERLVDRLRHLLPGAWWLGVGVSFSFLSGQVRRAPQWMRKSGLEWLHRLWQEPRRLFKRYIVVGIPFGSSLMLQALTYGIVNRLSPQRRRQMTHEATTVQEDWPGALATPAVELAGEPTPASDGGIAEEAIRRLSSSGQSTELAGRLRGLVLLGGSVRPGPLAAALGRSVLDLPTDNGKSVLCRWLDEATDVARSLGMERLPVRLLLDGASSAPRVDERDRYRLERDTSLYRGTGGLLANIAVDYADDDLILVGHAAQVLLDPLPVLLAAMHERGGIITVVGHRDGTPSGLMLVTCKALRLIPKVGFVDMKEQALPLIASHYDVRALSCRRPTGLTIRTLSDYVSALQALHQPINRSATIDPLGERWNSTFAIVEQGAAVSPLARLHDSVVLAGATVEAGAVVVRSVVAPGGLVRRDRKVVDECVNDTGRTMPRRVAAVL